MMRWGMPSPPKVGGPPVTNIRNTSSPHWRAWLKPENRCPANSFTEYAPEPNPETKKKDVVWFALNDDRPLFAERDRIGSARTRTEVLKSFARPIVQRQVAVWIRCKQRNEAAYRTATAAAIRRANRADHSHMRMDEDRRPAATVVPVPWRVHFCRSGWKNSRILIIEPATWLK
jgi:hypothetical protein